MDHGSHLLVIHRRYKQLLAADHAHYLPAEQAVLGDAPVERTQVVRHCLFFLRFVVQLRFAEIGELLAVAHYHLTDVFRVLVQPLGALDSIE